MKKGLSYRLSSFNIVIYSYSNNGFFAGILLYANSTFMAYTGRKTDWPVQKKALLPQSFFSVVASVQLKNTRVVKTKKSAQPNCRGLSTLIFPCSAQFVFQDAKLIQTWTLRELWRLIRVFEASLWHRKNDWSELCGRARFEICVSFFLSITISYQILRTVICS